MSIFHPDERGISFVVERMLLNHTSDPQTYGYGGISYYLLYYSCLIAQFFDIRASNIFEIPLVGRVVNILLYLGIGWFTYAIAYQITQKRSISLISYLLLSVNPFLVQSSHFYTVDLVLLFASTMFFWSLCNSLNNRNLINLVPLVISLALAMATKASGFFLITGLFFKFVIQTLNAYKSLNNKFQFAKFVAREITISSIVLTTSLILALFFQPHATYQIFKAVTDTGELSSILTARPVAEMINVSRMSVELSTVPYMLQYHNTRPYTYHISQMIWFTLGFTPCFLILLVLPLIYLARENLSLKLNVSNPQKLLTLVLSALSFFLIVGQTAAKFPRYLMPIYPILLVLIAISGFFIYSRIKNTIIRYCFLIALVFPIFSIMQTYSNMHPYREASYWIFNNIESGKTISNPHWDDSLPLGLDGYSANKYTFQTIPYYENSNPESQIKILNLIETSDYLIFPTPRIPNSYKLRENDVSFGLKLMKSIFLNKIGFTLAFQTKAQFCQLPFLCYDTVNLDESLSVYDSPNVYVFKKTRKLNQQQILDQLSTLDINTTIPLTKLLEPSESADYSTYAFTSSIPALIMWLLAIELFSISILPFLKLLFPCSEIILCYLARPIAIFLIPLISWRFKLYEPYHVFLILTGISSYILYKKYRILGFFRTSLFNYYIQSSYVWLSIMTVVSFLIAFHPEILGGEKPMDSSFLLYFNRNPKFPFEDPWAAGHTLKYYYFGYYIFAFFGRLSSIDPSITFNLAMSTIVASTASCLTAILLFATHLKSALPLAIFCAFSVNLAVFSNIIGKWTFNFDSFWASTRIFQSPNFAEFPLWSWSFGDLHPHVMNYPAILILITLLLTYLTSQKFTWKYELSFSILIGSILSIICITNTWDCFITFPLTLVTIVTKKLSTSTKLRIIYFKSIFHTLIELVLIGCSFLLWTLPFLNTLRSNSSSRVSFVRPSELHLDLWYQNLLHFGFFWLLIIGATLTLLYKQGIRFSFLQIASTTTLIILATYFYLEPTILSPLHSTLFAIPLCLIGGFFINQADRPALKFAGILIVIASFFLVLCESVVIIDRTNTTFKMYYSIWCFYSVGAFLGLAHFRLNKAVKGAIFTYSLIGAFALILCLKTPQTRGDAIPTLNGALYLKFQNPDEAELISWLKNHVSGSATVVEYHGKSYDDSARISMHTGLNSFLGWSYHVSQRGLNDFEAHRREEMIDRIYNSLEPVVTYDILKNNQVDFVVIGRLEKNHYKKEGLDKFLNYPEKFGIVFKNKKYFIAKIII